MNFSFYEYKEQLKRRILIHPCQENPEERFFEATWLSYALSVDGLENNYPCSQFLERLESWARRKADWGMRDIGSLCLLGSLLPAEKGSALTQIIRELLEQLFRIASTKWSPLNDPTELFPIALFVKRYIPEACNKLQEIIKEKLHGPLWRRLLLRACLAELGMCDIIQAPQEKVNEERDIIFLVWFVEYYLPDVRKDTYWTQFINIKDIFSVQDEETSGLRALDAVELTLLYQAISRETRKTDPLILFQNYPFEPEVVEASRTPFMSGNYPYAVLNAVLKLKEAIESKTGIKARDESSLLDKTLQPPNPKLKFNDYLDTDEGLNEQKGLYTVAKGLFALCRNIPGHRSSDSPLLKMDPYEALGRLTTIDLLMKRVKAGHV